MILFHPDHDDIVLNGLQRTNAQHTFFYLGTDYVLSSSNINMFCLSVTRVFFTEQFSTTICPYSTDINIYYLDKTCIEY